MNRKEYEKIKRMDHQQMKAYFEKVAADAVKKDIKEPAETTIGKAEMEKAKTEAYQKGYAEALTFKSEDIKTIVEQSEIELSKKAKEEVKKAYNNGFEEGRKSQKDYLTKSEKKRILTEIEKDNLRKTMLIGRLEASAKNEPKNFEEVANTGMAIAIAICASVLKDKYWKKTYEKKLPEFFHEVVDFHTHMGPMEMDAVCRLGHQYIRKEEK